MTHYTTIDASVGHGIDVELEIKRSRFITRLFRVTTEEHAREIIAERRKTHYDATHNCTAFIVGADASVARSSDDGEPAGTAGVPMLNVLRSNQLTDVVAVVTRYFGGIKLGAGGLIRAYSDAVAEAVERVGTRRVRLLTVLHVALDWSQAGVMEEQLRHLTLPSGAQPDVLGTTWTDQALVEVALADEHIPEFEDALAAMSAGALRAVPVRQVWRDETQS